MAGFGVATEVVLCCNGPRMKEHDIDEHSSERYEAENVEFSHRPFLSCSDFPKLRVRDESAAIPFHEL